MKSKRVSTARNNVKYTKRYANACKRAKVRYEHEFNAETNQLANPTGLPRMRQKLV